MSSLRPFSGVVDVADGRRRYFLDACFLCKKPIAGNCDIFMYRGDAPFCSEECRQEQIEMDEALELETMISRLTVPLVRSSTTSSSVKRKPTLVFPSEARLDAATAVVAG